MTVAAPLVVAVEVVTHSVTVAVVVRGTTLVCKSSYSQHCRRAKQECHVALERWVSHTAVTVAVPAVYVTLTVLAGTSMQAQAEVMRAAGYAPLVAQLGG